MTKRYSMLINVKRCFGCHSCVLACKHSNNLPIGINWMRNFKIGPIGTFPEVAQHYLPMLCMQCEKPICLQVCPTNAFYKNDGGIVLMDEQKCNGCGVCLTACPYRVINLDANKNTVSKCNFCLERLKNGKEPICVQTCMGKALTFGDINDSEGRLSDLIHNKPCSIIFPEHHLVPSIYYINLPDYDAGWLNNILGGKP